MTLRDENLIEQGKRIEKIIQDENMTQIQFSEMTGIKASTLNHVIKGRNNISPQVMNQILTAFPKYNEMWIRTGSGEPVVFDKDNPDMSGNMGVTHSSEIARESVSSTISPRTLFTNNEESGTDTNYVPPLHHPKMKRKISKIIVYYDDNTFETFLQQD